MASHPPTTIVQIREAASRISDQIHRTPVITCSTLDTMVGAQLYLKCENFQKVGAFKARGASNAVALLTEQEKGRGVATHSSGNHAQALAYAARQRGISCTVVMPENSPEQKVQATKGYGAQVVFCENTLQARETTLAQIVERTNAVVIHPYDNENVIAGQGTAALELMEEIPELDCVIAPVGGGGLMSGTCIAATAINRTITLFGAEPELAADAKVSLESGTVQAPYPPITIADGLRTALCERTFLYLQQHNVQILTASEASITQALSLLMSRAKLVVEPSSAVPLAALLENPHRVQSQRIGMILSGGNGIVMPSI